MEEWGIWNWKTKKFIFDIREPSEILAFRALRDKIGKSAFRPRYEVKEIGSMYLGNNYIKGYGKLTKDINPSL